MRRIILAMIATNALAAFSVQPGGLGVTRPLTRARTNGETATSGPPPEALAPREPAAPPAGKILPRGSLLDLSV